MKPRHKRAATVVGIVASAGIGTALVLNALNSNLAFFYTPTQVIAGEAPPERIFRIGGLVKYGSVEREQMTVNFAITDTATHVRVSYTGILPALFREGKGAVVQGHLNGDGSFRATEVLAKHDENYMPREAQHALDKAEAARALGVAQ